MVLRIRPAAVLPVASRTSASDHRKEVQKSDRPGLRGVGSRQVPETQSPQDLEAHHRAQRDIPVQSQQLRGRRLYAEVHDRVL